MAERIPRNGVLAVGEPCLIRLLEYLDISAGGPDRYADRGVVSRPAAIQASIGEGEVGAGDGELRGAPHPPRRRCPNDLLEVDGRHLAAPGYLVARGVEAGDLPAPRSARAYGRPEAIPPRADWRDHAHARHDHPAGTRHAGRSSRSATTPRSTAANVSFALTTGSSSTSATPRPMAAGGMTFSAPRAKSSWAPGATGLRDPAPTAPRRGAVPACCCGLSPRKSSSPHWARASIMTVPGMIARSEKCPGKKYSLPVTFFRQRMCLPTSSSSTRSTNRNGYRWGIRRVISSNEITERPPASPVRAASPSPARWRRSAWSRRRCAPPAPRCDTCARGWRRSRARAANRARPPRRGGCHAVPTAPPRAFRRPLPRPRSRRARRCLRTSPCLHLRSLCLPSRLATARRVQLSGVPVLADSWMSVPLAF